jgi:hypothetical protein
MSEEKAPYHVGSTWYPDSTWKLPDSSARDFLLELYVAGQEMPVASRSTIGAMLAVIMQLADGSYAIHARFNGHIIGRGNYSKLGLEIIVEQESGAMVGVFAPLSRPETTGLRCGKCDKVIAGEPSSAPSYDGPLCGSCAWGEWLAEHE